MVIDNRPGALSTIAMADVLKQPADGLSIFPMTVGSIATPALLTQNASKSQLHGSMGTGYLPSTEVEDPQDVSPAALTHTRTGSSFS